MRKRPTGALSTLLLLAVVPIVVQGCLGIGSSGKPFATSSHGQAVTENQNTFTGKFYLTINGNLYVLNGKEGTTQELLNTGNVMDPAVSPDGKWVAFVKKYRNYSDLCVIPTTGGQVHVLRSGNGYFYNDGGTIHNTYHWYAQPAWSQDGSTADQYVSLGTCLVA